MGNANLEDGRFQTGVLNLGINKGVPLNVQ